MQCADPHTRWRSREIHCQVIWILNKFQCDATSRSNPSFLFPFLKIAARPMREAWGLCQGRRLMVVMPTVGWLLSKFWNNLNCSTPRGCLAGCPLVRCALRVDSRGGPINWLTAATHFGKAESFPSLGHCWMLVRAPLGSALFLQASTIFSNFSLFFSSPSFITNNADSPFERGLFAFSLFHPSFFLVLSFDFCCIESLQDYVVLCCQFPGGGCRDKPGKWVVFVFPFGHLLRNWSNLKLRHKDYYHTSYSLSGLSLAQHHLRDVTKNGFSVYESAGHTLRGDTTPLVAFLIFCCTVSQLLSVLTFSSFLQRPTDPVYNICSDSLTKALTHFRTLSSFS